MRISDWSSDVCSSDLVLRILPFGDMAAHGVDADRSAVPTPAGVVPATFPKVERAQLSNGMTLVVARRSGVPLVNMTLLLRTGVPADYASLKPGTGALAMNLLDEGTTTRTGDQLEEELGGLGTRVSSGVGGERSLVSFSALTPPFLPSLRIFADVVLPPAFAPKYFYRLKEQILAGLATSKQAPTETERDACRKRG